GGPTGSVVLALPPGTGLSTASKEATAHGRSAQINSSTARTETVVPFPIEIFNSREGVYNGSMVADPTLATTNPNWDALYGNGKRDLAKNGGGDVSARAGGVKARCRRM